MENLNTIKWKKDLSKTPEQPTEEKNETSAKLFKERFQPLTHVQTTQNIPKISLKTVQGP